MTLPPVSPLITSTFNIARAKYPAEHEAWVKLSFVLSGRFNLIVASMSIQRQGDLDLLLRCMEDEFEANKAGDFAFHYQLMLSESWVVGCYEILRAFRQRDRDARNAGSKTSGVSEMDAFKSLFADFELLRMPMAKYEIAKDKDLKQPLAMRKFGEPDETSTPQFYDPKDPARYHIMPSGMGQRGSAVWKRSTM